MGARIYLDWNATAPVRPAVVEAVRLALGETGNASSVHGEGRAARNRLDQARRQVAAMVHCLPSEVVFMSGGTEANNAILSLASWRNVLVSAIEHDSVRLVRPDAIVVPVTSQGIVDLAWLANALAKVEGPTLVSVMLANNETGVIQPIGEIASLVHAARACLHSDAVQAAGRMAIDCRAIGCDYLSLSSHKIGGPQGVGALIVRGTAPFAVRQVGGGQERGRRGGTENVAGVVGFGVAAGLATEGLAMMTTVARLRDRFEAGCLSKLPAAHVWGAAANRLPNTSCIAMPGVAAETQVMALDLAGIAVSAGAACSSGRVRSSHVLAAMGAAPPNESIRVSLGEATTEAEIDRLIAVWCGLANRRRGNVTQAVAA